MSSIVYSFHWVRISRDAEKNRFTEETSLSTTNATESKITSVSCFNKIFKYPRTHTEQNWVPLNNFDFELLHSIV
ncbi:hypothetical protein I4U23_023816 [Adineta vaga]|nr:hypothetical protein I4U23_023816 [Adineta vaga]